MGKAEIESARQLADHLLATTYTRQPTEAQLAELQEALKRMPGLVSVLGHWSEIKDQWSVSSGDTVR